MSTSLVYRSARGYELLMRLLYGRHYAARMSVVAEQVPQGTSALELCCGPGTLYQRFLRDRVSDYIGLDANERFVAELRSQGVDARVADLSSPEPLPTADVAIIQASLYHFLPDASGVVDRMLQAARRTAIIAEPIRNLASSELPLLSLLSRRGTDPGVGDHTDRFTQETLAALMERYESRVLSSFLIPGGREQVYVLRAG